MAALGGLLMLGLAACTPSDQRKADERTAEAERKLDHAGQEVRQETTEAGKKLDKATLLARVKTALAMDAGLSSLTSVQVNIVGDSVELSGTVHSEAQKQEVERAASHVDGVAHVTNNVKVE